jgi:hypothetical protein
MQDGHIFYFFTFFVLLDFFVGIFSATGCWRKRKNVSIGGNQSGEENRQKEANVEEWTFVKNDEKRLDEL